MNNVIGSLNSVDWKKIGKGAIIAVIGALLTYLTPIITGLDLGVYTPIVVAFWSVVTNAVKKWLSDENGRFLGIGSK